VFSIAPCCRIFFSYRSFLGGRRDVCSVLTSSLEDMQLHIGLNRKSPLADKVCINSYLCYRLLLLMIIIIHTLVVQIASGYPMLDRTLRSPCSWPSTVSFLPVKNGKMPDHVAVINHRCRRPSDCMITPLHAHFISRSPPSSDFFLQFVNYACSPAESKIVCNTIASNSLYVKLMATSWNARLCFNFD